MNLTVHRIVSVAKRRRGSLVDLATIVSNVRRQGVSLAMVFVLAGAGYVIDEHRALFPWLIDMQSQALRLMTWTDPRVRRADHVSVVEIDDATFRARDLGEPTDRHFVATLIRQAALANAAVIMLDLDLGYTPGGASGDDAPAQKAANADLLAAIRETAARKPPIPVILAVAFARDERSGDWDELQNIFADGDIPIVDPARGSMQKPSVGFASGATDSREVPLVVDAHPFVANGPAANSAPFWSLSLRTADAYDGMLDIVPAASERPEIHDAIRDGEFVSGTFLPPSAFLHVSANDLAPAANPTSASQAAAAAARSALDHRIVLIGGVRKYDTGGWKDEHDTPLGPMIGVYIHANWIEALLDQRIKRSVPWWMALIVDIALGITLVVFSARARTLSDQLALVVLFAIPIAIAYVAFVDFEYSLDFTLPLLVLMVHLVLDKYREFGRGEGDAGEESAKDAQEAADVA